MRDPGEDDTTRAAQAFRPNARPLLITLFANIAVAGLCLGIPYARGHARAEDALHAFARFAGCLLGGEPQDNFGLALPPGERARFAAQVMRAAPDWPARCREPLHAIAPDEAVFLWPSIKQTGADVRAVVALLDQELLALARARETGNPGRVPTRPLLALEKLRGALALLARAGNVDAALYENAVIFAADADATEPSRLPLVAGAGAALEVWPGLDGLHALALDRSGVSWLRLEGGKVERLRVRRTSLVRGALRDGDRPLLVWAMPEDRCTDQENHCVHRATGLAYLEGDAVALPEPAWVAGHPAGPPERSLRVSLGTRIDLLARASAAGALEVRRFELGASTGERGEYADQGPAPPLSPLHVFALPAKTPPIDGVLLPGQPPAVAYAETSGDGVQALLWRYEADHHGAPLALGAARGDGGFVEACEAQATRWIAFGTEDELVLTRVAPEGTFSVPLPAAQLALSTPSPDAGTWSERIRIECSAQRAILLALETDGALSLFRCDAGACTRTRVARGVAAFDAALSGETAVVAYARDGQPQIAIARVDAHGALLGEARTPAPCWDPQGGMCGQPTLVAAPDRLLLCARDGSDLIALESSDAGRHWTPLRGLRAQTPLDGDPSAPMQQHRIRKGLD